MKDYRMGSGLFNPQSPQITDDLKGRKVEAQSQTFNLVSGAYVKDAAGSTIALQATAFPILNLEGSAVGDYWGNPKNLQYEKQLTSVTETDGAAVCVVSDADYDLEKLFESTGVGRYMAKVYDKTGLYLYGWIGGITKSTNKYTLSVYSDKTISTNNWFQQDATSFDSDNVATLQIYKNTSSIAWGSSDTFTEEVPYNEAENMGEIGILKSLTNGQYAVDYSKGRILARKANADDTEAITYNSWTSKSDATFVTGDIEIGAVELKDGATDNRAVINAANTARAATDKVLLVQNIDAMGRVGSGGSTGVAGGGLGDYMFDNTNSKGHGSVAYTAATQLTVSGLSFTPVATSLQKIEQYTSANVLVNTFTPQTYTITYAAGVYTVTGATFGATDLFVIYQQGPERTTNLATNSQQTSEQNPLNVQIVEESLADTTNVAAAATYYPSSLGMAMLGYKNFSITGKYIDGDVGASTISVQGTCDEDSTNADWIDIQGQINGLASATAAIPTVTGTVAGVTGVAVVPGTVCNLITTAIAQTVKFDWDFDNCNMRYIRVVVTPFDATNTVIIKCRRSY